MCFSSAFPSLEGPQECAEHMSTSLAISWVSNFMSFVRPCHAAIRIVQVGLSCVWCRPTSQDAKCLTSWSGQWHVSLSIYIYMYIYIYIMLHQYILSILNSWCIQYWKWWKCRLQHCLAWCKWRSRRRTSTLHRRQGQAAFAGYEPWNVSTLISDDICIGFKMPLHCRFNVKFFFIWTWARSKRGSQRAASHLPAVGRS